MGEVLDVKEVDYLSVFEEAADEETQQVVSIRDDLRNKFGIDYLEDDIKNCIDLISLAYNAVNGIGELPGMVVQTRHKLDVTFRNSKSTLDTFSRQCGFVIDCFYDIGDALKACEYDDIKMSFEEIGEIAGEMKQKAEEIEQEYKLISEHLNETLSQVANEKAKQSAEQQKLQEKKRSLEADMKAYMSLKNSLAEEIQRLTEDLNKLEKKMEKAEDREFALQLTSCIMSGLGAIAQGVGAGVQAYNQSKTPSININNSSIPKESKTEVADVQTKVSEAKKEMEEAKKEYEELSKESKDGSREENEKTEEARKKYEDAKQTYESMCAAVQQFQVASDSFQKGADGQADIVALYAARIEKIENLKAKVVEANIKNLANMAKCSENIKNTVISEDAIGVAIDALIIAINALNMISVIFSDFTTFWQEIEGSCEEFQQQAIKDFSRRAKKLLTDRELSKFLKYIASWVALGGICTEAAEKFKAADKYLSTSILQIEQRREAHWEIASKMAGDINERITNYIEELNERDGK